MDYITGVLAYLTVFFGVTNLARMAVFLVGSHVYGLRQNRGKQDVPSSFPPVTVIVPAYNEGRNIVACLASILASDYPRDSLQVLVVNDGSTDDTAAIVRDYLASVPSAPVTLVNQANAGKAHALNNGLRNHATGEFVMCLDADSSIAPDAIRNAVRYFADERVMALAANVRIARRGGLLNLVQVFEYVISYQMKKALTVLNIEYIIGGIGSMFRRAHLERIGYYDTNTVTEDIDLSMKILRDGNNVVRVIYGSDVIAYTESVLRVSDLIRQRYRWKWGRFQTFFKNKSMFFSRQRTFTKGLSWVYLPLALFYELTFLLEPLLLAFLVCIIFIGGDYRTLLSAVAVITFYVGMNIVADETLGWRDKLTLIVLAPTMYVLFNLLSFVEYVALLKSLVHMPRLRQSIAKQTHTWTPVERLGSAPHRPAESA
jgi:biofilm PGA synthesis N-glycosyltransferase PgaC